MKIVRNSNIYIFSSVLFERRPKKTRVYMLLPIARAKSYFGIFGWMRKYVYDRCQTTHARRSTRWKIKSEKGGQRERTRASEWKWLKYPMKMWFMFVIVVVAFFSPPFVLGSSQCSSWRFTRNFAWHHIVYWIYLLFSVIFFTSNSCIFFIPTIEIISIICRAIDNVSRVKSEKQNQNTQVEYCFILFWNFFRIILIWLSWNCENQTNVVRKLRVICL